MKVDLIDFMGSDDRVVDAARVSFAKEASNYTEAQNDKLIKYLATHDHWTPFSHVQITMREKVPIFVARQRFKSSVGFTYNEVSRRYVDDEPEFFYPEIWRKRADNKKQGSLDVTIDDEHLENVMASYDRAMEGCFYTYKRLLECGVAPEQARMVLPQSLYTEYYVTGSLSAWARAYKLRSEEHAQQEIQDLAKVWAEKIGSIGELKHSWEALVG